MTTFNVDNDNVILEAYNHAEDFTYILDGAGTLDCPNGMYTLTFIAKPLFIITSAQYQGGLGQYYDFDSISSDGQTATHTGNFSFYESLLVETEAVQPPIEVVGFNHLYLVNRDILKEIGNYRFAVGSTEDIGVYIINVLELPFSINEDIKGNEDQITVGETKLNINAIELTKDEMLLDLGSIDVPSKYDNTYDYINTNVYLHLPFSEKIELDVNYTISQTISITYIIDLYTGDTSINIKSSKLDNEVIENRLIKIGKNIPFVKKGDGTIINDLVSNNGVNNQIFTPFIEVIRNKPHNMNNPFNDDMTIQTKLLYETGLVRVNDIILETNATLQEKKNIISILQNGVFIK